MSIETVPDEKKHPSEHDALGLNDTVSLGLKMGKMKRIELLLPDDHPIWGYPRGVRRNKAVELLNMGLRIDEHLISVKFSLFRKIAKI